MGQNFSSVELLGKVAAYTELLGKDPHSTIFVPLCEAYRQLGRLDEAVAVVAKGIMENPSFPAGYVALGRIRYEQDLIDQAIDEFEKALILDKNNLPALKGLAEIHLRQKNREEARKLLDRMIGLDPDNATVVKLRAFLEKTRSAASAQLADVSRDEPTGGAAAKIEAEEHAHEPIATGTIAEIYIRQGFPEKALKVYRDLLRVNPQNDQLLQKLASLRQQIEEKKQPADEGFKDHGGLMETTETERPVFHEMLDIESPGPVSAVDSRTGNPLVGVLNGWLDAIARRREIHVR